MRLKQYLKLAKILMAQALLLLLTNCKTINISTACPDIPFYTEEEQLELDRIRKEANSLLLDKVLIDYGNLREDLRECNKAK